MRKIIMIFVIAFLVTGCGSGGNRVLGKETSDSIKSKIIENKTTQSEIKSLLGSPVSKRHFGTNEERWDYYFFNWDSNFTTYIPVVGFFYSRSDSVDKNLVIFFKEGVVSKYTLSEVNKSTKNSLF